MRQKGRESRVLWAICIALAIGGPLYIFRNHISKDHSLPNVGLFQADAQKDPYCFDVAPVGDGVGYNYAAGEDCYLDSESARLGGVNPKNYCFDASPQGDGKGWDAYSQQTCFFGTDPTFGPPTETPIDGPLNPGLDMCIDSTPIDGVGFNAQRNTECYLDSEIARANGVDPRDYCFDTDPTGDGKGYNAAQERHCYFQVGGPDIEPPIGDPFDPNPAQDLCVDTVPIDGIGFNGNRNAECYLDSEVARANGADPQDYCFDAEPTGDGQGYNAAEDRTCFFQIYDIPVNDPPPGVDPKTGSKIEIPANLQYSDVSAESITLSWDRVEGAEGYNIERNGSYFTTVRDTTFIDSDVDNLRAYIYRVSAFADSQYSDNSMTVKVVAVDGGGDISEPPADKATLPANLRDQYSIAFFDEFNGEFLDPKKWNTSFVWGPDLIINNEEQYYVDVNGRDNDLDVSPFSFDGNSMTITASKTPSSLPADRTADQEYISGLITSRDAFKFTHGYAEARVKVPKGQGLWPAFWLLNAYYLDGEKKPEIDIMELLGHQPSRAYQTYHYFDPEGKKISSESHVDKSDYSDGYYIFSAEWKPGLIQFYIDGEPHHKIEGDGVADEQMYVLANLAVGGWWPGTPDSQTEFPAEYSIDWIRVYQKK